MIEHPNVIPITVVSAFLIFVAKELLEAIRRRSANKRKLSAIKDQVAAECERNNWVIRWIRLAASDVTNAFAESDEILLLSTSTGRRRLAFRGPNGDSSSPIPKVHTTFLEKYLFEVASLDGLLFQKMQKMLASLAELEHVLENLIELTDSPSQDFLDMWPSVSRREVADIEEAAMDLYEYCTGGPLVQWRVR